MSIYANELCSSSSLLESALLSILAFGVSGVEGVEVANEVSEDTYFNINQLKSYRLFSIGHVIVSFVVLRKVNFQCEPATSAMIN